MKRFCLVTALACLLAGTLWAADDPFGGKWKLNMEKSKFSGDPVKIQDLGGNKYKWTVGNLSDTMKFDGKDYEEKGPNVAPGSMSSGKRVTAHTLEVTDKVKGEVLDHTKYEVSPDGKTLTLTIRQTGQPKELTMVYDKM
jgi:hypothetical protein